MGSLHVDLHFHDLIGISGKDKEILLGRKRHRSDFVVLHIVLESLIACILILHIQICAFSLLVRVTISRLLLEENTEVARIAGHDETGLCLLLTSSLQSIANREGKARVDWENWVLGIPRFDSDLFEVT